MVRDKRLKKNSKKLRIVKISERENLKLNSGERKNGEYKFIKY